MDKQELTQLIEKKYLVLKEWLEINAENYWDYGPDGKWTTGQQILHLVQSTKPLAKALSIPKLGLKLKFGKSKRQSKNYDEVVADYQHRLVKYANDVTEFNSNLDKPDADQSRKLSDNLIQIKDNILSLVNKKWTEKDLDTCLLPHPLIGKMTVREILLWTAYHTEHHTLQIIARAKERKLA